MTNATKLALEESLKRLLLKKPLDKITINDLTTDCGISRMTFYYHFKDIYDLVEWSCLEDARIALQGKKTSSTWHEGREQIENYLFALTCDLLMGVVTEKSKDILITEEQKIFIADLYKYSFVGIMLDWIKNGMREDYHGIVDDTATALYGCIDNAIHNFAAKNKTAGVRTE